LDGNGGLEMKVAVTLSKTINLGNYENEKVECGLEADFDNDADILDSFDFVHKVVKEFLDEKVSDIESGIKRRRD
jgi:hypothetical protein